MPHHATAARLGTAESKAGETKTPAGAVDRINDKWLDHLDAVKERLLDDSDFEDKDPHDVINEIFEHIANGAPKQRAPPVATIGKLTADDMREYADMLQHEDVQMFVAHMPREVAIQYLSGERGKRGEPPKKKQRTQ